MSFCWFSGSTVRMLIRVVTCLVTAIVVLMISSCKKHLCPYTMKTIPLIKTDRSGKKRCGFFRVGKHNRCLNLASRHGPILLEQTALFLT
jgi:hypothetical protein